MKSLLLLCAVIGLSAGFRFPFPLGLFRRLHSIEDYERVAHLPPVKRRFETWVNKWITEHEECGQQAIKPYMPHFRIVGGQVSRPGSWPWMISLVFNPIRQLLCAAALIDKQWLVTAAHCFGRLNQKLDFSHPETWTIKLGKYDTTVGVQEATEIERRIARLYVHPRVHEGAPYNNDIALIKLDELVELNEYIRPLCLPGPGMEFEGGSECVITGWGMSENPKYVLRQAAVPLVSFPECRQLQNFADITSNMVCAGYTEGGADACRFDSGGPIQCQRGADWYLAGITSFGINNTCGQPATPGVYTDVTKYLDWIYWHLYLDPYF